ncbi:MAG: class I SAM-dependent methyltransferase [Bacteroidetes bacterium]|nr:class I SAM-dependent methyltransferase [Bacteroidota bacterium]
MSNINDSYFDGYYKDIWKTIIPAELTGKETDFMIPYFQLSESSRVLDLMCGYGRHTLALARKGISVTAVDNLHDYTKEIKAAVETEQLPVTVSTQHVLDFTSTEPFDLALCMGNSLNFFNADDTLTILKNISACLKPGGQVLINTWSIAEIAIPTFKPKSWSEINGMKFLTSSQYLFQPARIVTEHIIIAPDGSTETKTGIDYILSLNEMESLFHAAGLSLKEVYSIPGRKKFTIGEPRAYLVGEKVA